MKQRSHRTGLGVCALLWFVMMFVHHDFWLWKDARLLFGILPVGLAYHAGYSLLACGLMAFLVRRAWPSHLEDLGEERPGPGGGGPA